LLDVSYIYDDDELADASTIGNRSCASFETIKSLDRITLYDEAFCDDTIASVCPYLSQHKYVFNQFQ
jgi:hypothetical protein